METWPKAYARVCGAVYAVVIVAGIYAEFVVRDKLVVPADALVTAQNVAANEFLWRSGIVANLIGDALYVVTTLMLYVLLKPVSKDVSLLAAFFSLIGCASLALIPLGDVAVLKAAADAPLVKLLLQVHGPWYLLSLAFFGCYCMVLGSLIFRSGYLPKALGVLLAAGGLFHVVDSSLGMLVPVWWLTVPDITIVSGLAEIALTLWLLVAGVNLAKWNARVERGNPAT